MPQATHKFDANKMRKLLENETEYISNLFAIFDVPDSVEGKFYIPLGSGEANELQFQPFPIQQTTVSTSSSCSITSKR